MNFIRTLKEKETVGTTESLIAAWATSIKNWNLISKDALSDVIPTKKTYEARINKFVVKRIACAGCPIGCGGTLKLDELGREMDRPEYETVAGFGPMCLNNDINTVIKANDICK